LTDFYLVFHRQIKFISKFVTR